MVHQGLLYIKPSSCQRPSINDAKQCKDSASRSRPDVAPAEVNARRLGARHVRHLGTPKHRKARGLAAEVEVEPRGKGNRVGKLLAICRDCDVSVAERLTTSKAH